MAVGVTVSGAVAFGFCVDCMVWSGSGVDSMAGAVALVCGGESNGVSSTVPQAAMVNTIPKQTKNAKTLRFISSLFSWFFLIFTKKRRTIQKARQNCLAFLYAFFPQHFLYFFPLPHGHGAFRSILLLTACLLK